MSRPPRDQRAAEAALRQVVNFLAVNVNKVSAGERRRWHQQLWQLAPTAEFVPRADDTRALLRQVQCEVSIGIRATFAGDAWEPDAHPVLVAVPRAEVTPVRWIYEWTWRADSEADLLVAAVADLVQRAGSTLRECSRCHDLFLGRKRGVFCSTKCQQREMDQRKLARRKAARQARTSQPDRTDTTLEGGA